MIRLGVNVDHIATVREARKGNEPDPVAGAILAEMGGADGIVCHLREDRRHIKDRDLSILRQVVKTHLNMEMAPTDEMVKIAERVPLAQPGHIFGGQSDVVAFRQFQQSRRPGRAFQVDVQFHLGHLCDEILDGCHNDSCFI